MADKWQQTKKWWLRKETKLITFSQGH